VSPPARPAVVLGVDLGTQSAKAVAYDVAGGAHASAFAEYALRSPAPGREELDPEEVVAAFLGVIARAAAAAEGAGAVVSGVACSAAMHTLVGLDAAGRPVTAVLTYADTRAIAEAAALRGGPSAEGLHARTGTPLHPMSPLAKLRWFSTHAPATAQRVASWVSVKELALRRLFADRVVDHSIASASGLFDVHTADWDDEALTLAGIDRTMLSRPVPTMHVLAGLSPAAAAAVGLPAGTPFVIGASDGALANLGAGAVDEGVAALTIGSSGAVRTVVDAPETDRRGRLFCYALTTKHWVVGGPVSNGGLLLRWLRDQLLPELAAQARAAGEEPYHRFDQLAAGIPAGAGGLLFLPAFTGERAPRWDPTAGGALVGLTRTHGRGHVIRAAMEGVAYQLAAVVAAIIDVGRGIDVVRATGGFTASPLWLQVVADVLGRPLEVPRAAEGTCLGAALLGMQALGMADAFETARECITVERTVRPIPAHAARHARLLPAFTAATEALAPTFSTLAAERRPSGGFSPAAIGEVTGSNGEERAMAGDDEWYWCLQHGTAERREGCRAADRLGPYASAEEAARWRERVDARNERWEDADERWSGEGRGGP